MLTLPAYQTVNKELDFFSCKKTIYNNFERSFARNCVKNGILFSKKFCNEQFETP